MDISDHLPIFCIANTQVKKLKTKKYGRVYLHFDKHKYINEVNSINWDCIRNMNVVNSPDNSECKAMENLESFVNKVSSSQKCLNHQVPNASPGKQHFPCGHKRAIIER